jgi:serine phosphatase RsbU (regulator of sigma subunit)
MKNIAARFLHDVDADERMSGMLLDQTMRVMDAPDRRIIGLSVIEDGSGGQRMKELAERYLKLGTAGTEIIDFNFQVGAHEFDRGIVSIQPVEVLGKRWWLTIGSDMTEVNSVVQNTLKRVLWWGIFVVVSMTAILVSTAVQMIRSRVRLERARHEALTRELSQARKIQLAWLPKNEDDPPHVDLCAINKPASHISGDFYNWFDLSDGRVCVVIGDVTGHGTAAAFLMATTQLLVRTSMPRVLDPGKCLEEINRQLCQQAFNGQFVTMLIMLLDRGNGRIELATAGHPPPLIATNGRLEELQIEPELVLGIEKSSEYPTRSFELPRDARLVLYTDGVVDAIRPDEKRFGLARLRQCVDKPSKDAQAIADAITGSIDAFRAGRELVDDLTLVTIQLKPEVT